MRLSCIMGFVGPSGARPILQTESQDISAPASFKFDHSFLMSLTSPPKRHHWCNPVRPTVAKNTYITVSLKWKELCQCLFLKDHVYKVIGSSCPFRRISRYKNGLARNRKRVNLGFTELTMVFIVTIICEVVAFKYKCLICCQMFSGI